MAVEAKERPSEETDALRINRPDRRPHVDAFFAVMGATMALISVPTFAFDAVLFNSEVKVIGALKKAFPGAAKAFFDAQSRFFLAIAKVVLKDETEEMHARALFLYMVFELPAVVALHYYKFDLTSWLTWALVIVHTWHTGMDHWKVLAGGHDHMEGHSVSTGGWFKAPFGFFKGWTQYVMIPLCGRLPEDDTICHNYVHHKFCNNLDDIECHLWYNRLSGYEFICQYSPRQFVWRHLHIGQYLYFKRYGFHRNASKVLRGQIFYVALVAASAAVNPITCLYVFVLPLIAKNMVYNSGEWAMHSFSNCNDPTYDPCMNSSTLWGEEYATDRCHAVHHALGTTYNPTQKVREEEAQYLIVEGHNNIPIQFRTFEWRDLCGNLFSGNVDAIADDFVFAPGTEIPREELKKYLVKCCEPVKGIDGVTESELKQRKLIGPVHFDKKGVQARVEERRAKAAEAAVAA